MIAFAKLRATLKTENSKSSEAEDYANRMVRKIEIN